MKKFIALFVFDFIFGGCVSVDNNDISSDGQILEATLKFGGFASKGDKLKVIHTEQGRLYCEK